MKISCNVAIGCALAVLGASVLAAADDSQPLRWFEEMVPENLVDPF